jgi:hypothetical protein
VQLHTDEVVHRRIPKLNDGVGHDGAHVHQARGSACGETVGGSAVRRSSGVQREARYAQKGERKFDAPTHSKSVHQTSL